MVLIGRRRGARTEIGLGKVFELVLLVLGKILRTRRGRMKILWTSKISMKSPPFITKDGSEIRELLAHRNSAIRNQSLAEARLPVGRRDAGTFSSAGRGDLLHHARHGKNPHRRRNARSEGRGRHRHSARPEAQAVEHAATKRCDCFAAARRPTNTTTPSSRNRELTFAPPAA